MRIGPYILMERIGAGGMGEVWRAHDMYLLRDVAVKILPAALASDRAWKERFLREARIAARLNHPNIAKVYSVGDAKETMYIAMELVDGRDLGDVLAKGPLTTDALIRIGADVATALHEAHCAGIVHRDVKPENILVTDRGAKVLDFGIASFDQSHASSKTILGTPQYMSPEQAHGGRVDARSDLFSLGVVLYQALTGVMPFEAETPQQTLVDVIHKPHPPLRNAQRALADIIDRCLQKAPEDRFASAMELAVALRGIVPARALVVDDDELARVLMQSALADAGFAVDEAENGCQAIEHLGKHEYDAMFLDLVMPQIDGWTVLDFLHKVDARKPRRVYVASGVADPHLSDADAEVVTSVLRKPLLPRQMIALALQLV